MSLLTSPHQPPPAPPASPPPSPSAVPNDSQSPKQPKEPLSHRLNDFMASKPKMHCLRSLRRGVSVRARLQSLGFVHVCERLRAFRASIVRLQRCMGRRDARWGPEGDQNADQWCLT